MTPGPAEVAEPPPLVHGYDNRGASVTRGGRHFRIEHAGRSIAFCYIRKNACSAFKALVMGESPWRSSIDPAAPPYRFLREYHAAGLKQLASCDRIILVVREPLGRLVSAFRNKFIQRAGKEAIFASYLEATGRDPETATFRDFVERYLSCPGVALDKHVQPQSGHLLAIRYTDAVPLERLHPAMVSVFGSTLADRYFAVPINTSRSAEHFEAAADAIASDELNRMWRDTGRLPSDAALMTPDLARRCAELCDADLKLYREILHGSRDQ